MKNSTINYYDLNAQKYSDTTLNVKMSEQIDYFCSKLSPGASILDVGCGSGRDSLFFIKNNFQVTSIDASKELANLASNLIGQKVIVTKIEDFKMEDSFDAVWAMASLLHLKKEDLPKALDNCISSMKKVQTGLFFASFKMGEGESYDENGRFFSYYKEEELSAILKNTGSFDQVEFFVNKDKLGRGNDWISFCATTTPELKKEKNKKPKC